MTDRPDIIDELKAGLPGVTPGPWDFEPSTRAPASVWAGKHGCVADLIAEDADGYHIARCSPDNIAALLAYIETVEAERDARPTDNDMADMAMRFRAVNVDEALSKMGVSLETLQDWQRRAEAAEARVAELTEIVDLAQQNSKDNWAAFTTMRNDINEIVGNMRSSESTLLEGPEMAHECEAVVFAVRNRMEQLKQIATSLLEAKPDRNPSDGPCCYTFDEKANRWYGEGCTCGNYDDAQNAAHWAEQMNRWLEQAPIRAALAGKEKTTPTDTDRAM